MNDLANKCEFLAAQMADHEANWSLGTFGAIAEFMRDAHEPVALSSGDARVAAVTARGGIRIEPREHMRLFASESKRARAGAIVFRCACLRPTAP